MSCIGNKKKSATKKRRKKQKLYTRNTSFVILTFAKFVQGKLFHKKRKRRIKRNTKEEEEAKVCLGIFIIRFCVLLQKSYLHLFSKKRLGHNFRYQNYVQGIKKKEKRRTKRTTQCVSHFPLQTA